MSDSHDSNRRGILLKGTTAAMIAPWALAHRTVHPCRDWGCDLVVSRNAD